MCVGDPVRNLLQDVLKLPVQDRAEIAAELLRSLDADEAKLSPEEVERLWADEITRRAQRALSGESVGRDATEVLAALDAKLRAR